MSGKYQKLNWQEEINGYNVDCSLDIAIHPANSDIIFLTIPGVDGSIDGYENKYVTIADNIQDKYGAAIVRMSNPYISSFFWESNIRQVLQFIEDNAKEITGKVDFELRIMAHSAGAAILAQIAWEYPLISRILLVNPAMKLNPDKIKRGLAELNNNKLAILVGSKDPSISETKELRIERTIIVEGADHNFSGDTFPLFLEAPDRYLFNDREMQ
jgi:pimeloyl-ACP methyl ester carboxylesterase